MVDLDLDIQNLRMNQEIWVAQKFSSWLHKEMDFDWRREGEDGSSIEEVFERFIGSKRGRDYTFEPVFAYPGLRGIDWSAKFSQLASLVVEIKKAGLERPLRAMYLARWERERAILEMARVVSEGDDDKVCWLSDRLYGPVDEKFETMVEKRLAEVRELASEEGDFEVYTEDPIFEADQIIEGLRQAAEAYGMGEVVEIVKVPGLARTNIVAVGDQARIMVPEDRRLGRLGLVRLITHEVEGHLSRWYNGQESGIGLLGLGEAGYETIDEGFSSYQEREMGTKPFGVMPWPGVGLVMAKKGVGFGRIFVKLKEEMMDFFKLLGLGEARAQEKAQREAWQTCLLISRGLTGLREGAKLYFARRASYLWGESKVNNFIVQGGEIDDLAIGRISLDYLDYWAKQNVEPSIHPKRVGPQIVEKMSSK